MNKIVCEYQKFDLYQVCHIFTEDGERKRMIIPTAEFNSKVAGLCYSLNIYDLCLIGGEKTTNFLKEQILTSEKMQYSKNKINIEMRMLNDELSY